MILKNFSSFLVPLAFFLAKTSAKTISSDTYMNNGDFSEDSTINQNTFLAMVNGNTENIQHSLTVQGSLFIGDTNTGDSGLQVTFSGPNLENDGLIVVDDRNLSSGSMTLNWGGSTITNNGKMYFNGQNSNSNNFNLNPSSSLTNNGLIYMGQDQDSGYSSSVNIKSGTITNSGTICLKNVKAYLGSSIGGNGCISIGENTVYAIQSDKTYGSLGPQTLYMTSPSSIIYVDTSGLTDNIIVRGFGGGNYLSFGTSIVSHSYSSDTGVLSFSIFIFITHKFNIGKGYDNSKFSEKQIDNHIGVKLANNALYYNGDDPNGVPSQCMPCDNSPWIPVRTAITTSEGQTSTAAPTTTSTSTSPPKPPCQLTTTMAITDPKIQNLELSAYVRDILGNMGQYLSFRQANPDQPYPTQLNQIVMNAMFAGKNDGWTSSLTGIDPNTVEMMLTGVPWYSTRILPVLQQNLASDRVYVQGINSDLCAPQTSAQVAPSVPPTSTLHIVTTTSTPTTPTTSTHTTPTPTTANTVNTVHASVSASQIPSSVVSTSLAHPTVTPSTKNSVDADSAHTSATLIPSSLKSSSTLTSTTHQSRGTSLAAEEKTRKRSSVETDSVHTSEANKQSSKMVVATTSSSATTTSSSATTTSSSATAISSIGSTTVTPSSSAVVVCPQLTTTMAITDDKIQNLELSAYVRDILGNMGQYLSFRQANPDQPYPTQLNQIVMNAMFAGKNDGWTSSLTGIDPNTVEMMLTGVPWYSTRILPVLQKDLNADGIFVEGINPDACVPKTSTSSYLTSKIIATSSTHSTVITTTKNAVDPVHTSEVIKVSSTHSSVTPTTRNTVDADPAHTSELIKSSSSKNSKLSTSVSSSAGTTSFSTSVVTTSISKSNSRGQILDASIKTPKSNEISTSTSSVLSMVSIPSTLSTSTFSSTRDVSPEITQSSSRKDSLASNAASKSVSVLNSSIRSKETIVTKKYVSMTKITTVITTDNHVVTLTTTVPSPFSDSKKFSIKATETMPVASHNGAEQYSAPVTKNSIDSTSTVRTDTTLVGSSPTHQVINKPSSSYPGYRYSNQTTTLSKNSKESTALQSLLAVEHPTQTKDFTRLSATSVANSDAKANVQQPQQQEVALSARNQNPAVTTTIGNSQTKESSFGNGINTKIAVQSMMSNAPSTASRISIQQNVNGATQSKLYGPLFSIFLLITSMYI